MRTQIVLAFLTATALAAVACGDMDAGPLLVGSHAGSANAPVADPSATSDGANAGANSGSSSGTDVGGGPASSDDAGVEGDGGAQADAAPVTDAGASGDAAATPSGVFAGAPAFVASTAGKTHNAGKNCMSSCHNHGFSFAGTLTTAAGAPVVGAEVRLVDATGAAISVHTGSTGNFHSSTPFTAPAKVAVRDAIKVAAMVTPLQATNSGCNACHAAGGTTAPIHLN